MKNNKPAVIVTTAYQGVFFGYAVNYNAGDETIKLERARLCVYWSADMKGFMGLAAFGPSEGCKIGPPADIELRNITSVIAVTDKAVTAWEKAPWLN